MHFLLSKKSNKRNILCVVIYLCGAMNFSVCLHHDVFKNRLNSDSEFSLGYTDTYVGQCVRPKRFSLNALVTNFDFDLLQQIANLLLSTSLFSIFVKLLVRLSVQYIRNSDRTRHTPFICIYVLCVMCGERKISKCVSVSSHALSNRINCRLLSSRYTHVVCCRIQNRPRYKRATRLY